MDYTWPAESFDALGFRVPNVDISLRGADMDDVKLEGEGSEKHTAKVNVDQLGRWLWISTPASGKDIRLTLLLPKHKTWPIDLYAKNVRFRAENVKARMNLILGKGEVRLRECRGALSLVSGNTDVVLESFTEEEVPEMPLLPDVERKERRKSPASYMSWAEGDWSQWSLEFSEKTAEGIFKQKASAGRYRGIDMKAAWGDVKMKSGRISNLDLNIIRGDIVSEGGIPGDEWKIKTHSGNIYLSLPSDINTRIDAATRHGDIKSVMPLVRVTRQGPEPWHGRRMVGIIGSLPDKKAKVPEVHLSVLRGDIIIETKQAGSRTAPETEVPAPLTPPSGKTADYSRTAMAVLEALSERRITVGEAEEILDGLEFGKKVT